MGYNLDQENEKGDYSEGAKDRREDRSGRKRVVTVITSRVAPDGTTEDKIMRGYRRSTSTTENHVVGKGERGRR